MRFSLRLAAAVVVAATVAAGAVTNSARVQAPIFPWFNLSLPWDERVAALVDAATLPEQISWLNDASPAIPRLGLPAYSWEGEASHGVAWAGVATVFPSPIAWGASFDAPLVARIGAVIAVEARAKWVDGRKADGSSAEFAGLSFMVPNSNLFLDPRWGRGQETLGEDPLLTSSLTEALIVALQDNSSGFQPVIATMKHFLGYHLESWNGNSQYRLYHSYNYSDADIAQYYARPFAAAVNAGVSAVMCAYDGQNGSNPLWKGLGPEAWGVPMCLSPLLEQLLRGTLGFKGYVISDEGAVTFAGPGYHGYTATVTDAACLALAAGTDLCLGGEYADTLATCVARGNVTAARVAQALTRTLSAHARLGWFDTIGAAKQGLPDPVPLNAVSVAANVSTAASRGLALRAAVEGLTLLKNARGVLPLLAGATRKLALVGPAADDNGTSTGSYIGNYAGCTEGPGGAQTREPRCAVVTLRAALANLAIAAGFTLDYAPGCDVNTPNATAGFPAAIAASAGATTIVAALGLNTCQETACSEGEAHDRLDGLDLPGSQLPLLLALREAYPTTPIVLVVLGGGPVSSPRGFEAADAVLFAWYPGYEGGNAITDTLFGAYAPAGRLPVTLVADTGELPLYTDTVLSTPPGRTHMYYTGAPLFPFGFGLSYATFAYSNVTVSPPLLGPDDASFTVSATVTRDAQGGPVTADEVVQLYGSFGGPSGGFASIPRQSLLAFAREHDMARGERRAVTLVVPRAALALVAPSGGDPVVSSGAWALTLGGGPPSAGSYPGGTTPLPASIRVA